MAYVRPANPIEINSNNTKLTNPRAYLFGTLGNQSGDNRYTPIGYGSDGGFISRGGTVPANFSIGPDYESIAPNLSKSWLAVSYYLGIADPQFTRIFVFDVADPQVSTPIYISKEDTGGGYVAGALYIRANLGAVEVLRSNQAQLSIIPDSVVAGTNVIALSRQADKTILLSINGADAVTVPASDYLLGPSEFFGVGGFRGDSVPGLKVRFYAKGTNAVDAATVKSLSANPMQVVRTVGTAGDDGSGGTPPPADTTPPALSALGTTTDGTAFTLTASEALKNQSLVSSVTVPNHTVSAITISGSIATISITPAIAEGENAVVSYVANAGGFVDLAGNQLPSFSAQPIANNVNAGFWKFLGNEGQSVTVAANTLVRYGVTGAYTQKPMSGTFTINNTTFTDPAPGSTKHADAYVSTPATGYTFSGPALGPVGESGLFTVAVDGLISGDLVITPSGAGLTFSPATITLNNNNMTATFSLTATAPGEYSFSLANNKNYPNPAAQAYTAITSIFKTFGAGGDYATLDAAILGVSNIDPAGAKVMVVLEGLSDVASVNSTVKPASANDSFYYLIRPKKELSFAYQNKAGALHESMPGAKMTIAAGGLKLGGGVVVEGYIINITIANGINWLKDGAGPDSKLRRCFVLANADNAMNNTAYKASALEDCFIIRTSAHTGKMFNAAWVLKISRTTWYNKSGAAIAKAHNGGWGNGAFIRNSAYVGFGTDPIEQLTGFVREGNVSTSALSDTTGFIVDTTNAAFVSSTNYRAGPALLGRAVQSAKSINDILTNNRGTSPDAGAAQQVAALDLAVGTMSGQPVPDAQRIALTFTYTGTVSSATVTLTPIEGGLAVGPLPVTVGGGTGSVQIDMVEPGSYLAPDVQLINAGGSNPVSGFVPFEIIGVGGGPVDPGVSTPATAVVWNPPSSGNVGEASAPFAIGLNGTLAGTVRVTPTDGSSGGTFLPEYVDLVNGGSGSFIYTPANSGNKNISLTNDKGLQNPQVATYIVVTPTVIVSSIELPLTTDGTTAVADMTGLQYAWFDQPLPQDFTAPKVKGNNGSIVGGKLTLSLPGSVLDAGGTGYLVLTNTNGDSAQSPAALVFAGPVKVQ
jgi:hypothetical protein